MHSLQASSPGTHAAPQMVQALVQDRQASRPSTRTGSTGALPHIGQSSKSDAFQLSEQRWLVPDELVPLRTGLVQVSTDDRTLRAGTLDSAEA